jgi:transcription initiation factor TFIIIB Brf1 subunit/transcription initiation factor TFIIB
VAEEAESLVIEVFRPCGWLSAGGGGVALLWTAAKAAGAPRPLEDFLKCSRAEERRVRGVAWRLKEAVGLGRRSSVEDYVGTLAARVDLPASIVKSAVELLERNRRLLTGKNPWVSAAAALWLASFKKLGLLKRLAEASSATPTSIRKAFTAEPRGQAC